MSNLRKITAIKIENVLPASILETDEKPVFEWVDPNTLYIEEKYQRNLSDRSVKLIHKIFKDFKWSHFKPPVCSWGGDKLYVIDGQHTAIALASHPKIKKIPIMVVGAHTLKDRAIAFIGHNKDRLAVTAPQLFYSSLTSGDPLAEIVDKALKATGCTIVRWNPPVYIEGQTMAADTLVKLAEKKGLPGVTRVLKILMDAKRAPIRSLEITSLADLLWGKDRQGKFTDFDITTIIRSKTPEQWRATAEAHVRKGMNMPMKRAIALTWYKAVKKKK